MKKEYWLAIVVVYLVIGFIDYKYNDHVNPRFRIAFPSLLQYMLSWPYWELKGRLS